MNPNIKNPNAVDPTEELVRAAGKSGTSYKDVEPFLPGLSAEEDTTYRNSLAEKFGFKDYDSFVGDIFKKPSQTSVQTFNDAFTAAGLPELTTEIETRKKNLAEALDKIGDDPWLTQDSYRGRAGRLEDRANRRIANLLEDYKLRLGKVKELVANASEDFNEDARLNEARFKFLEDSATQNTKTATSKSAAKYLPAYLDSKAAAKKPDTISVGSSSLIYQWDPDSKTFKYVTAGPKAYGEPSGRAIPANTPRTPGGGSTTGTTGAKYDSRLKEEVNNVFSGRYGREGAREEALQILEAEFPGRDVALDVYNRIPDGFKVKTSNSLNFDDF